MSDVAEILDDEVDLPDDKVDSEPEIEVAHGPSSPKHISKEDWVASGKDPDEWRSPREFRERGEFIDRIQKLERKNDSDIKNLNMLHEIRLKNEREELLRLRDDAIDVADRAEVKRLDAKISANEEQAEIVKNEPAPQKSQEVVEWEEENPWCNNPADPRLTLANSVFTSEMNKGRTMAAALRAVDREIAAKFTTPQKRTSPQVEGSRTAGGVKQNGSKLSWSQLTPTEEKCYVAGMWKNEDEFLKAVANDRKGSK